MSITDSDTAHQALTAQPCTFAASRSVERDLSANQISSDIYEIVVISRNIINAVADGYVNEMINFGHMSRRVNMLVSTHTNAYAGTLWNLMRML